MVEQILVLIKPDAMKLGYLEPILERFCSNSFIIRDIKIFRPNAEIVEDHYRKVFLEHPEYKSSVVEYITSGVLAAAIFERKDGIQKARELIGPLTNAPTGTIRGDFREDQNDPLHTIVHASDSSEAAKNEIEIWFPGWEPSLTPRISIYSITRRNFMSSVLLLGSFSAIMGGVSFAKGFLMNTQEERERLFAQAIADQKNGNTDKAKECAQECLGLLKDVQSLNESAATEISIQVDGQSVLLPGLLHTDTALLRFRSAGILI